MWDNRDQEYTIWNATARERILCVKHYAMPARRTLQDEDILNLCRHVVLRICSYVRHFVPPAAEIDSYMIVYHAYRPLLQYGNDANIKDKDLISAAWCVCV